MPSVLVVDDERQIAAIARDYLTRAGFSVAVAGDGPTGLEMARQKRPDRRLPKRARVETEGWEGVDRELFDALRTLRLEIARGRGVPPYVVFHDSTLREMAKAKPQSLSALLHVPGVGARKAEDFGQ